MDNVARQLGMPSSAVPPPLPPLPPPPVFSSSVSSTPMSSTLPHAQAGSASRRQPGLASPAHAASTSPAHVSASPHASLNNDDTFGSAIGMDNPMETLERIARGVFGECVNGTASGANFCANLNDELPPY